MKFLDGREMKEMAIRYATVLCASVFIAFTALIGLGLEIGPAGADVETHSGTQWVSTGWQKEGAADDMGLRLGL